MRSQETWRISTTRRFLETRTWIRISLCLQSIAPALLGFGAPILFCVGGTERRTLAQQQSRRKRRRTTTTATEGEKEFLFTSFTVFSSLWQWNHYVDRRRVSRLCWRIVVGHYRQIPRRCLSRLRRRHGSKGDVLFLLLLLLLFFFFFFFCLF